MTDTYDYINEDGKNYKIIFSIQDVNFLHINIIDGINNDIYSSSYYLDNLNEKFNNIFLFKTIKDFQNYYIDNIKKPLF